MTVPDDGLIAHRIDFADAALALVNADLGDARHRVLVHRVAGETLTADEAVRETAARAGLRLASAPFAICDFDDYLIPGTFVLRNRLRDSDHPFGIDDPALLRRLENEISRLRIVELAIDPVIGSLDYDHMKSIHRRIFGDVYEWAGTQRVGPEGAVVRFAPDAVNFEPGDPAAPMITYQYFPGPQIAEAASVVYAQLADLARRSTMSREDLIDRMAELAGEVQTMHAFRDGNSRAVYVFAMQFFERLGFTADPSLFLRGGSLRERMIHARFQNHATGRHEAYYRTFDALLSAERSAHR
ncbi:Fic/DOC family protein [Subtercola sp. YIM 133946]|uniref:Fic/DOC family protein n=1 Tax=Subtercola sp. YIM 133946 TaxID=3118909 RepID=UPI002F9362B9